MVSIIALMILILYRLTIGMSTAYIADMCSFFPFVTSSPICDSYVRPATLVRICEECNFGTYGGRCIVCGSPGISVRSEGMGHVDC